MENLKGFLMPTLWLWFQMKPYSFVMGRLELSLTSKLKISNYHGQSIIRKYLLFNYLYSNMFYVENDPSLTI